MRRAWWLGIWPVVLSGSCNDYAELSSASRAGGPSAPSAGYEATGGGTSSSATGGGNGQTAGAGGTEDETEGGTASAGVGGETAGGGALGETAGGGAGAEGSIPTSGGDPGGNGSSTQGRALGALADSAGLLGARRVAPPDVASLPRAYDLSDRLPPPGDQGPDSSAVAWAVATTKSFLAAKQNAWPILSTRYQFSPTWIYSQVAGGLDEGARPSDALDLLVSDGADTTLFFPHRVKAYQAVPDKASFARAARFKSTHWGTLPPDPLALKQSIASQQPVVATFEVYPDFDALDDDNWLYEDTSGSSRGRYAAVLVGYDDDKAAFKVLSSWGSEWGEAGFGWLAYDLVEEQAIHLAAYVLAEGRVAPPATAPNLYVVENGQLWRVDGNYGDYVDFGRSEWEGSEAITALSGSLFIAQGPWLHRVNPVTGSYSTLGEAMSTGSKWLTKLDGSLFLLDAGVLWQISDFVTGHRDRASTADFSRATALTATSVALFVVQDGTLIRVAPQTGETSTIGDAIWYGPTWMTELADKLYLMNGGAIWVIDDLASGRPRRLGHEDWTKGSLLTTHDGALYALRDHQLCIVDGENGTSEAIGGPVWVVGTVIMVGLP